MNYSDWTREFRFKLTRSFLNRFRHVNNDSPYDCFYLKDFYGVMLRTAIPADELINCTVHLTVRPRLKKRHSGDEFLIDGVQITIDEESSTAPLVDIEIGTFRNTGLIDAAHLTLIQQDKKKGITGFIRFLPS